MTDKKRKLTTELNLGLNELLSHADNKTGDKDSINGTEKPSETSIVTFEDDLNQLNRELLSLAEQKQWGILVSRAETSIASEEDIEARLWWVRGHLGALTLPVSLLAAPFETVCRQLVGDVRLPTFTALLKEIGDIMIERLRGVGDRRQEYAVRLVLCQLGIIEPDEKARKSYGKIPPKRPNFELGTPSITDPSIAAVTAPPQIRGKNLRRRVVGAALLVMLLVLLGGAIFAIKGFFAKPALLVATEDLLVSDTGASTQQLPVLARHISSNLGAVFYSMNEGVNETVVGEKTPTVVQPGRVERPPAPEAKKAKETVRTDGPVEGPEFKRGVEPRIVPEAHLPEVSLPDSSVQIPGSSYPDGSLIIGGEVKSAIVATEVYDSPNYGARVIARLSSGDKVSVEGRVGQWLRIRSRRGRAGFVYEQDIGKLEDFRSRAP
jgi:hypothetical protein